eukprot:275649_1
MYSLLNALFVLITTTRRCMSTAPVLDWIMVYENDSSGSYKSGNINDLIQSIDNGAECRIVWENSDGVARTSFTPDHIWVKGNMVYAQTQIVSISWNGNNADMQYPNDKNCIYILDTHGRRDVARYKMSGSAESDLREAVLTETVAAKWFVR